MFKVFKVASFCQERENGRGGYLEKQVRCVIQSPNSSARHGLVPETFKNGAEASTLHHHYNHQAAFH